MQRCGVDCRRQKVTFGVMETFCEYILTIVVVAHLYTLFRVHQSVHLKGVNFAACKFHLDKPALTGGARRAGVSSSPDSCRAWPGLRGQLLRQVPSPLETRQGKGREGPLPRLLWSPAWAPQRRSPLTFPDNVPPYQRHEACDNCPPDSSGCGVPPKPLRAQLRRLG